MANKHLIIIAGANGSGKTTFGIPYVKELGYDFLNADIITKKLEEEGQANALVKAGRIFFKRLNDNLLAGNDFVVETTLSGSYINKVAVKAKQAGYKVKVIYIYLENPQICIERVKSRVIKGGHDVPEEAIVRRYFRSKNNFWYNFTILADEWLLLYNGEKGFQNVAIGNEGEYRIENESLFGIYFKNL